jgi:hypothetical protein
MKAAGDPPTLQFSSAGDWPIIGQQMFGWLVRVDVLPPTLYPCTVQVARQSGSHWCAACLDFFQ